MKKEVVVVIGVGGIGQAIARRQSAGRTVLLADLNEGTLESVATSLRGDGHDVSAQRADVSSRESVRSLAETARSAGQVVQVIHTAGLSPLQARVEAILRVNLLGAALVLEEFGRVVADGGAGVVIASMSGHLAAPLTPEQEAALRMTPSGGLLELPFVRPEAVTNPNAAYGLSKRANQLRVQSASTAWGERGARINSISPGVIATAMGQQALAGEHSGMVRAMVAASGTGRIGTPADIANATAFLLGPDASFITGTDLLVDGGVTAAMFSGRANASAVS
jgi:meso-butanediol dehydrogenase/(S,S)-butanediol dehydrogenase/diacetyl reductase